MSSDTLPEENLISNSKVLLSIVLPVFNAAEYLKDAIDSVLNQTFGDWELLIADDGSSDSSVSIIEQYVQRDPRIKHFPNHANIGYLQTCNKLFLLAKGDLVTFQDADDISMPNRFEEQVRFLKMNPECMLVGTHALYFQNCPHEPFMFKRFATKDAEIKEQLFSGNQFCGASVMFRKKLFEKIGFYKVFFDRIGNEDYDYFFRASQLFQVANIPMELYCVRNSKNSISRTIKDPRQIISDKLVLFLARQRQSYGCDSLTGLDVNLLLEYQEQLLEVFRADPSVLFRTIADRMAYIGFLNDTLRFSFKAFVAKPFAPINIKYLFRALQRFFFT